MYFLNNWLKTNYYYSAFGKNQKEEEERKSI